MSDQWNQDPFPTPDCADARARVIELHKSYLHLLRNQPTQQSIEAELRREEEEAEKLAEEAARADDEAERAPSAEAIVAEPETAPASGMAPHAPEPTPEDGPPSEPRPDTRPLEEPIDAPVGVAGTQDEPELPAHVPGTLSEASVENLKAIARRPRAGEERKRVEKFRRESRFARKAWAGALFAVGIWMAYGLGSLLGTNFQQQVLAKLKIPLPAAALTVPLVLGLAVLLVFACWGLARAQQLHRMATKAPREIPYLDNVGHIYEIEVYHAESGEENAALDKKLETQRKTLLGGKSQSETKEDLTLSRLFFGVIVALFAIPNVLFYPHQTIEQWILAVLIASAPVAFVVYFSWMLANHTVDWPLLSEELMDPSDAQGKITAHENRLKEAAIQRVEARKAAEEARKKAIEAEQITLKVASDSRKHELAKQTLIQEREAEERRIAALEREKAVREEQRKVVRAATAKVRLDVALKQHETDAHDGLAELREAASTFENHRGYSKREQEVMRDDLTKSSRVFWGVLFPLSAVAGLFATYPASLTIAELFNQRFQYFMHNRVAIFPWVLWCVAIAIGEWLVIMSLHKRKIAEEQHHVLVNFYDEQERLTGHRYRIKTFGELAGERKGARSLLISGLVILVLEFLANAAYLLKNTESNMAIALLLALVPLTVFVGLTFPNSQSHTRRHKLKEALAWARSLPVPQRPSLFNRNNAPGTSAEIRDLYERATGYVDPASPKRKVD
jgi:hypothetical protein